MKSPTHKTWVERLPYPGGIVKWLFKTPKFAPHGSNAFLAAFFLPLLLLPVMSGIFILSNRWLGADAGYLFGFGFYWLVWCLLVPRALLGKAEFAAILKDRTPLFSRNNWLAAFLWLVITLIAVVMYVWEFLRAPLLLVLLAVPLATINGFCEELLWRGLYVRRFPRNPWLAILYPALGFALWHFAPQIIFPSENVFGFVVSTFFLALPYGYIAWRTGSARWTTISHSLNGVLTLSGMLAPSLLALLTP
jgi:membrane protease YdiL (CAAX protease family)